MSIQGEIRSRRSEGRLVLHEPLIGGLRGRAAFVEAGVYNELTATSHAIGTAGFRVGQLVRDIDRFSNGDLIAIGYGREKTCFMKLLDPQPEEVWEIRSRDPKPSYRLFCRFAAQDVLIILSYAPRSSLYGENSKEWDDAIRQCKARWRTLFPTYNPFKGTKANDYIRENVIVVGHIS